MAQGFTKDYLVKATGETKVFVNGTAQASTSGTEIDFTIPSGVKEFSVSFAGVSLSGTNDIGIQLGDDGGIETSGYVGSYSYGGAGTGGGSIASQFVYTQGAGTNVLSGTAIFKLQDAASNTWCSSGGFGFTTYTTLCQGHKPLSGELTTVRIMTIGSDTFDAGSINVQYENPELAVSGIESTAAGVTNVFVNGTKQASTSGTAIDFTVPSGVKKVTVLLNDVSTDSNDTLVCRIGDSGGIETTGYLGATSAIGSGVSTTNYTTSFLVTKGMAATYLINGVLELYLMDEATNLWGFSTNTARSEAAESYSGGGSKPLSGELTTVSITTAAADTFDGGSINIQYDNQDLDLGSGVISGGVVQTVHTQDGEFASTATNLPVDDTIPTSSEGAEFMSASITPTSTANKLRIDVTVMGTSSSVSNPTIALFQDSGSAAIAVVTQYNTTAHGIKTMSLTYWMTAGTESSTTFKVRAGASSGTFYFNGSSGLRRYGGVAASSITITEYKV